MHKIDRKHRKFEKHRREKLMRRRSRRKKNHYTTTQGSKKNKLLRNEHLLSAPCIFSIENNAEEMIDFFDEAFQLIKRCGLREKIFFDLSNILKVSADAVMYLIAMINNTRRLKMLKVSCSGNFPEDATARKMFEAVGFYDYVKLKRNTIRLKDPEKIRILHGREIDSIAASKICDFVNEKNNTESKMPTKRLYPMIVELMTNTTQHAYKEEQSKMFSNWYLYVENSSELIKFVFLDTGAGIPATIRKHWKEKVADKLLKNKGDDSYIEATLLGEFRTETRQDHRGKGLPEIYNAIKNPENKLSTMSIVSGRGICSVLKDGYIEKKSVEKLFEGTLFSWNFEKEVNFYGKN